MLKLVIWPLRFLVTLSKYNLFLKVLQAINRLVALLKKKSISWNLFLSFTQIIYIYMIILLPFVKNKKNIYL